MGGCCEQGIGRLLKHSFLVFTEPLASASAIVLNDYCILFVDRISSSSRLHAAHVDFNDVNIWLVVVGPIFPMPVGSGAV